MHRSAASAAGRPALGWRLDRAMSVSTKEPWRGGRLADEPDLAGSRERTPSSARSFNAGDDGGPVAGGYAGGAQDAAGDRVEERLAGAGRTEEETTSGASRPRRGTSATAKGRGGGSLVAERGLRYGPERDAPVARRSAPRWRRGSGRRALGYLGMVLHEPGSRVRPRARAVCRMAYRVRGRPARREQGERLPRCRAAYAGALAGRRLVSLPRPRRVAAHIRPRSA
jgi:hypothetical protein